MKLIKELLEARRNRKGGSTEKTVVYQEWDGLIDDGVEYFDVEITYTLTDNGVESHPYGMGYADEDLGFNTEIKKAVTKTEVKQYDEDGENVIKTFPKGTDVTTLPGWKEDLWKQLQKAVDEDDD